MPDHPFRVIAGGGKPKPSRARRRSDPEPLQCHACEEAAGHSGAVTMTVKLGEMIRDGKPYGGTKAVVCAHCMSRGVITILI